MPISLHLSDAATFDDHVQGGLPTGDMLHVTSKQGATADGLPAVVLSFESTVGGTPVRSQHVVTLRELVTAVKGLVAHHEAWDPAWKNGDVPRL